MNLSEFLNDTTVQSTDAAWVLNKAFVILSMQGGFALLEAGYVASKNVGNIMMKNLMDTCIGGLIYWAVGYAISFGSPSNWFCGFGSFFVTPSQADRIGSLYVHFVYNLACAVSAGTIVSGAVAERMNLTAYNLFSAVHLLTICLPCSWAWNSQGFLKQLGFHDLAGAAVVHMSGGATALVACWMLGPRLGRYEQLTISEKSAQYQSLKFPFSALTGALMLWWGWLSFNSCGTMAVHNGYWKLAAKTAINTMCASMSGCLVYIGIGLIESKGKTHRVDYAINGLLAGLVAVSAGCGLFSTGESCLVASVGAVLTWSTGRALNRLHIDDCVGAVPVHMTSGMWGTLMVAVFGWDETGRLQGRSGLLHGGSWANAGAQLIGIVVILLWKILTSFLIYFLVDRIVGCRMSEKDELRGADESEHDLRSMQVVVDRVQLQRLLAEMDLHAAPHNRATSTAAKVKPKAARHSKSKISAINVQPTVQHKTRVFQSATTSTGNQGT